MAVPIVLATGAVFGTANLAHAYGPVGCAIHETGGNGSVPTGGTDKITFQVLDKNGNGDPSQSVTFSEGGASGGVNPGSATSDSSGNVSTTFTAGSSTGQAFITATDSAGGCSGSATVTITAGIPNSGQGGTGLPNTAASPPGPSAALYLGLGLALMVILGGAVTLRRSRSTAS